MCIRDSGVGIAHVQHTASAVRHQQEACNGGEHARKDVCKHDLFVYVQAGQTGRAAVAAYQVQRFSRLTLPDDQLDHDRQHDRKDKDVYKRQIESRAGA